MEVFADNSIDPRVMYKFIDRDGSVLALRSDMTQAIARIAATAYDSDALPMRFCYIENSFRHNISYRGMLCEFTQAGIELIGVNTIEADAEAVMIAVDCLKEAGLDDFKIDMGHAEFLRGVIEEAGFDEKTQAVLRGAAIKKEYTTISEIVDNSDINEELKSILIDLPFLIGDESVLTSVKAKIKNEKSVKALDYLEKLYAILKAQGYDKYISFDLSVMGAMDYYTGIIFRGYAQGSGFSIVDGGRYDNLVSKYGADYPAVGFAIKLTELANVLPPVECEGVRVYSAYSEEGRNIAFSRSKALRESGMAVEFALSPSDYETAKKYVEERNIPLLCYYENDKTIKYINKEEHLETKLLIDKLLEEYGK
jgi:ATP phosphoribosyltransferase regulatory subunit